MQFFDQVKYLFLIIIIITAAAIETDIYLPAFPDMMAWFSASESSIQRLLSWNFVGICISGPFYGPLSDAFGRRKPLLFALAIFLAGSLVTIYAHTIEQMVWGRVLQGLGSGGCFTLGIAILFDVFQKDKAISAMNNLNTIVPIIMALAPMIGGYLNQSYGFRSNFLAITFLVLISTVLCVFSLKETLTPEKRVNFEIRKIANHFKQVFLSAPFWQITIATSLQFAAYIAFLSGTSVLFMIEFGMSKSLFPYLQATILAGWVLGSLILSRCVTVWGTQKIKRVGASLLLIGTAFLTITTVLTPRDPYFLTCGMVVYTFGANWIFGLYFPEGMEILPEIKGITSSLATSARLLIAALVVGLTSSLYNGTIYPLTTVVVLSTIVILVILGVYERKIVDKIEAS